jgi:hypothetical protein
MASSGPTGSGATGAVAPTGTVNGTGSTSTTGPDGSGSATGPVGPTTGSGTGTGTGATGATGATGTGAGVTGAGTGVTGSGTGSGSGTGTGAALSASAIAAMIAAAGKSKLSYGLLGQTMPTAPKSTMFKGSQINSPLGSFSVPVDTYQTPQQNQKLLEQIENAKNGGIIRHMSEGGELPMQDIRMRGKQAAHANIFGYGGIPLSETPHVMGHADGGPIPPGHNPQFFSEGGLGTLQHTYVTGDGDGTSDSIPAMLANGEFVIPADVVSSLGNGSNDSGAKVLDEFLKTIREHKRRADAQHLPPDSKGALGYLLEAKKKVKA